jgi:glycosyltransferase involved in cell wall biosynthesis
MSRSLLFLAYYFAPHHAVAAVRTTAMARHLAELGWDVTVLTIDDALLLHRDNTLQATPAGAGSLKVIRTPHRLRFLFPSALKTRNQGVARLVGGMFRIFSRQRGIEREIGWRGPAWQALQQLEESSFDVILSSGGPWLSHALAAKFARKVGRPYVLDYRDLWCDNPHAKKAPSTRERHQEHTLRTSAAAITAVSQFILSVQSACYGDHPRTTVVTNGYDISPDWVKKSATSETISLLYAGQFYPPKSTIAPLLAALRELRRRLPSRPIVLRYVGPSAAHVNEALAASPDLADVIVADRVPREEALRLLQESTVAFVSTSNERRSDPAGAGIITGKIFEIFACRKPYLVIAPENSELHQIVRTAGGGKIFTADDTEGMATYLEQAVQGNVPPYARPEEFAWHTLATRMDGVLQTAARSGAVAR